MKLLRNKKPKISVLSFVILGLIIFSGVSLKNIDNTHAIQEFSAGIELADTFKGDMKTEGEDTNGDGKNDADIFNNALDEAKNEAKNDGGGDGEDKCGDGGGAKSLGWIVCPLMSWAGEAAEGFYSDFIEPSLQIEPQLFTGGSNNTLAGWQTFQNIANIIFAILFMVVIFSQITGVGIDNYGIKKILPKLIITAVLINLSYFICMLLVDASNIIGSWAKELFDGLGQGLSPSITVENAAFDGKETGASKEFLATGGLLVALGVAGTLVGMSGAIWSTPAVLLSLAIGVIGVAVSILMLFILLAARQAAVVVMIVISPLAVVCYALPNTKNLFDKWLKIFKVLLLLYPITGLLVGGGNYVSALLLSIGLDGIFQAITAMLAGIIPIFFIPSLTRSALAGIGNLGAKISGAGNRIGVGMQKKAQNSQAYQGTMEKAQAFRTRKNAEAVKGLYNEDGTKVKGIRAGIRRVGIGGRAGALSAVEQNFKNSRLNSASGYSSAMAGIEDRANAAQVADEEAKIGYGRVSYKNENGEDIIVNSENAETLGKYHNYLAREYGKLKENGASEAELNAQKNKIKAVQNLASKTEKGRSAMQRSYEDLIINGDAGVQEALVSGAAHLSSNYGDIYKSKNRGANEMIHNLAEGVEFDDIRSKVSSGAYHKAGVNKYTTESLASADEQALTNLRDSIANMDDTERKKILETVNNGLAQNADSSNSYSLKPEVKDLFTEIRDRAGGVQRPPVGPNGNYGDGTGE